jgi:hypothetical protein
MNLKLLVLISVMAEAFTGKGSINPTLKRGVRRYLNIPWTLVPEWSF